MDGAGVVCARGLQVRGAVAVEGLGTVRVDDGVEGLGGEAALEFGWEVRVSGVVDYLRVVSHLGQLCTYKIVVMV